MQQNTLTKSNLIEKIIRDAHGRLMCATFCIYEHEGRIKARLVSSVLIENELISKNTTLALSGAIQKKTFSAKVAFQGSTVSPYFNVNLLYSSGSKPRAPTFI